MAIVAGVDPGRAVLGFCAIDTAARVLRVVALCSLRICGRTHEDLIENAGLKLEAQLRETGPSFVAIEDGYVGRDPRRALELGDCRGALIYVAKRYGAVVHRAQPSAARQIIGLRGRLEREVVNQEVIVRVQRRLNLPYAPKEDAANAAVMALWGAAQVGVPVPF